MSQMSTPSSTLQATNLETAKIQATRVTLIGMFLDLFLGIVKIAGGSITQSFALVTDGIHSITDAITDIFVLVVARIANTAPDSNHPYGHGRFETLGTIAMGVVFITTAAILLYDSYIRLRMATALPIPATAGLAIAAISIASKEWIYHYTMRVARRLDSSLLRANAWHSRSDAISSIAVLVGILGAQQGFPWMDTVAGVFVSLIIAKIGWELCTDSLKELVDTAVPDHRRIKIEQAIVAVEGVEGITSMRTRSSAGKIILEICLLVNPRISVSEGHHIGENVSRSLTGNFSDIGDVVVHIDPEEHGNENSGSVADTNLPPREDVLQALKSKWSDLIPSEETSNILLHYLENGIEVDLTLDSSTFSSEQVARLEAALADLHYILKLRVYCKLSESGQLRALS